MTAKPAFDTVLIDTVNGLDLHESTDRGRSLFVTRHGELDVLASAWGPAADRTGNWFVCRVGGEPLRVDDRAAAIAYITAVEADR